MSLELLEAIEILHEDGEGAAVSGDANIASVVGGNVGGTPGINTTADVAMYPQYLGMYFRGGKALKMHNKKRKVNKKKRHLEEALSVYVGEIISEMNSSLSKSPQFESLQESEA